MKGTDDRYEELLSTRSRSRRLAEQVLEQVPDEVRDQVLEQVPEDVRDQIPTRFSHS
jgi:hypothetical protein